MTRGERAPSERRRTSSAEDVVGGDPPLVLAHVGQKRSPVDVTDGEQPVAPRHPKVVADLEEAARLDPDRLEADVGRAGAAAERGQHLVRLDRLPVVELERDAAVAADARRRGAEPDVDPAVAQRLEYLLAGKRLLALDQALAPVDERDRRAEGRPRLRHLDADDSAAQDREPAGHLGGRRRLDVRPRLRVAETRDRVRHERCRSGRDDDRAARDEHLVTHRDLPLACQPAAAAHEGDAALLEPRHLRRVVEVRDHLVAPMQDCAARRARRR